MKWLMQEQFFGNIFRLSLMFLIFVFVASVLFFRIPYVPIAITIVIMIVVSFRNPFIGLRAVFLELFLNAHGHILSIQTPIVPFSLRMAVFVGFFIGYIGYLIHHKTRPQFQGKQVIIFLPLIFGVLFGILNGMFSQNPMDAFNDANAYFFLLYLIPIFSLSWDAKEKNALLQVLCAGALWNIFASLIILYVFTHFGEETLRAIYTLLRNMRLAEITQLDGSMYRVFMQTQLIPIAFGAFCLALLSIIKAKRDRLFICLVLSFVHAVAVLSFSRSFWIALVVTGSVLIACLFNFYGRTIRWSSLVGWTFLSGIISVFIQVSVIFFPIPSQRALRDDFTNAFRIRTESEDAAISSRWKLLKPMQEKITQNPFVGSGFGTKVMFATDDPRIRQIQKDGSLSTYAMEWGWLELWLKMGVLGPIGFLFIYFSFVKTFWIYKQTEQSWLGIGGIGALTFLFVTHIFSPYLNHPLGLGLILFLFIFLPEGTKVVVQAYPHILKETPLQTKQACPLVESEQS